MNEVDREDSMTEAQEMDRETQQRQAARRRTPETALIVDALGKILDEGTLSVTDRERLEVALVGYAADVGKVEHSAALAMAALFPPNPEITHACE